MQIKKISGYYNIWKMKVRNQQFVFWGRCTILSASWFIIYIQLMKAGSWLPTVVRSCSKIQARISKTYSHKTARKILCYSFAEKVHCIIVTCERHTTPEAPQDSLVGELKGTIRSPAALETFYREHKVPCTAATSSLILVPFTWISSSCWYSSTAWHPGVLLGFLRWLKWRWASGAPQLSWWFVMPAVTADSSFPFPGMLYPCDMLSFRWPTTCYRFWNWIPWLAVTRAEAMAGAD